MAKFFQNKIKISLILILAFGLMVFASYQKISSADEVFCQEISLGQNSERIMEIHKEMIKDTFIMKQEYEKMFPPAGAEERPSWGLAELATKCWREIGYKNYCPRCSVTPCPYLGEINQELEKVKEHNLIVQEKKEKLEKFIEELENLKIKIEESKTSLASWNPEEEVLVNCIQAKAFGYIDIDTCPAENDYYICKIK